MSYRIVQFDARALVPKALLIVGMATLFTVVNVFAARAAWVKEGENFVLFFPVIVGIFLYGFATGAVFAAGQSAWSKVVEVVQRGERKEIERVLEQKPDQFPTYLMFIGWIILLASSFVIRVPQQMLFLLWLLHATMLMPLFLALDYWGFTDGIKRIEEVTRTR